MNDMNVAAALNASGFSYYKRPGKEQYVLLFGSPTGDAVLMVALEGQWLVFSAAVFTASPTPAELEVLTAALTDENVKRYGVKLVKIESSVFGVYEMPTTLAARLKSDELREFIYDVRDALFSARYNVLTSLKDQRDLVKLELAFRRPDGNEPASLPLESDELEF
jgi:hypothetical protein